MIRIFRRTETGWTKAADNFSKSHCDGCGKALWVNPGGDKYCDGDGKACDGRLDAAVARSCKLKSLDDACRNVQEALGVTTGDNAGMFWDDLAEGRYRRGDTEKRRKLLRQYVQFEHEHSKEWEELEAAGRV